MELPEVGAFASMILPISSGSARRSVHALMALAALLVALTSGCRHPGKSFEREMVGTEAHAYRFSLGDGSFVSLRIWQPSLDVTAKLVGPGGISVPIFDDPCHREEPDRLVWSAKTAGEYRLIVKPQDPKSPRGRYRLELRELRGSRSGDMERVAAEREYEEGRRSLCTQAASAQARARLQKALRLWKEQGEAADQVDALVQLVNNFKSSGLTPLTAMALSRRALKLAEDAGYREGEAQALRAVGNVYDLNGDKRADAVGYFNRSIGISRSLRDDHQLGIALYSLGWDLYNLGQPDPAMKALEESRAILTRVGDLSQASQASIVIAYIFIDRGETARAVESYETARKLTYSLNDSASDATVTYALALLYRGRGELEMARKLFEQSLALNVQIKNAGNQAKCLQALGSVYFNLGDLHTALSKYTQALEVLPKTEGKDLRGRLLTNIGYIYQEIGDTRGALAYYKGSLPVHQEAKNDSGIALTLNNMGVAYASLGDPRQGINLLNQALVIRHTIGERGAQAASLLEVGTAYQKARDLRQAEESFRQALELAEKVESSALQAESHFRLAALQSREGRLEPALKEIRASIAIVESLRSNVLGDKLRNMFFASKRAYYELFIDILMKLEALHAGQYQEAALEASEGARSRGLLDLLAGGNINVQKGIDPSLKQREIELIASLSDLQNKLGRAKATEAAALEHQLENIQTEMEDLASQIRLKNRQYAEVRYPKPLHLKDIQAVLDDRTALLQYFTAQDGTFLFVVTRQGLESYRLPPREDLATQVMAIRQTVQKRGKRQLGRFEDLATRLYAELIAPAEGTLKKKDHLLIAPDGPLYLLPFEVLLTDSTPARSHGYGNLPYLLRRFSVSYVPSTSVLQGLRAGRAPLPDRVLAKKFVGFADPVFSREAKSEVSRGAGEEPARQGLERLNESGKEVQRIASLYPSKDVLLYTGALATKANVQKVKAARQIDFATHGTLNETRPELSSLELTDGRLTVYEIFNLQLDADIITLSACDTGLGHEVSGEGIVGMNRAFFYAGAKSLVVSLWPVSDRSTSDLMYDFYRHLGKSEEKREALRRAKLAMIQSDRYAEPYYWAPLVLSGEPR